MLGDATKLTSSASDDRGGGLPVAEEQLGTIGTDQEDPTNNRTIQSLAPKAPRPIFTDLTNVTRDPAQSDSTDDDSDSEGPQDSRAGPSILARQARNIQRNHLRLQSLGLTDSSFIATTDKQELFDDDDDSSHKSSTEKPTTTGMLLPTRLSKVVVPHYGASITNNSFTDVATTTVSSIAQDFPHRHNQIVALYSLLSPLLPRQKRGSQCDGSPRLSAKSKCPTPILVSGPNGTGKTSIVRRVVYKLLQTHREQMNNSTSSEEPRVGAAYVDCSTLDRPSIEGVVAESYKQLAHSLSYSPRDKRKKRSKKRKYPQSLSEGIQPQPPSNQENKQDKASQYGCSLEKDDSGGQEESEQSRLTQEQIQEEHENNGKSHQSIQELNEAQEERPPLFLTQDNDSNDIVQTTLANCNSMPPESSQEAKSARSGTDAQGNNSSLMKSSEDHNTTLATTGGHGDTNGEGSTLQAQQALVDVPKTDFVDLQDPLAMQDQTLEPSANASSSQMDGIRFTHTAVSSFGRELQRLLQQGDSAFLILDHAENLSSLSSVRKASAERNNFLSQFFLLSSVIPVNLTVIAISADVLLGHYRFNQLDPPNKSPVALSNATQPIRIHFPAYKSKSTFKEILSLPRISRLIVGQDVASALLHSKDDFAHKIVDAFLDTLVQSLHGSVRDLKEFIRLARSLWPLFIEPLSSSNMTNKTVNPSISLSNNSRRLGIEMKTQLCQSILPHIRNALEGGIFQISPADFSVGRKDQGRTLDEMPYLSKCLSLAAFICQNNRAHTDQQLFTISKTGKRKKREGSGGGLSNTLGSSTSSYTATRYPRQRPFPCERMFSVYMSIIGLHRCGKEEIDDPYLPLRSRLSDFNSCLSNLRVTGILHQKASTGTINLVSPQYTCTLTREEADAIAMTIKFNLADYLI